MRRVVSLLCIVAVLCGQTLFSANDTFFDYQNYNHGYCPDCNYYPCRCDTGYCPNPNPCPTCPQSSSQPPYPQELPSCPPSCNTCNDTCDPAAPVCGSGCGVSVCAIAVAIAAVAAAAAIIIGSTNGAASGS